MLKIATWNVNSLRIRLPQVLDWLQAHEPDILALQEIKVTDEQFPRTELEAAGYQSAVAGQRTYNGVAVLSRLSAADIVTDLPDFEDPQRRILGATLGDGLRVLNVYVPNGQAVDTDKYAYKLYWLDRLTAYLKSQLDAYPCVVVLGDFNIAPEDRDVHDPQEWAGKVLFSEPERAAFQRLLELGLKDAFRLFEQKESTFSWWDYRAAAFRRNRGLRIDHILVSPELAKVCETCTVDKEPRRSERPSDHAPVIAQFSV